MREEMTYQDGRQVPAKPGTCDGCGERKPIVMVSGWGNYCLACSDDLFATWQKSGQKDWNSRVKPVDLSPFELQDDGAR